MPYISQEQRRDFDSLFATMLLSFKPTSGELNYIITRLILATQPKCYDDYNKLVGVLECCKLEFYRRAVANYEQEKAAQNGDIF